MRWILKGNIHILVIKSFKKLSIIKLNDEFINNYKDNSWQELSCFIKNKFTLQLIRVFRQYYSIWCLSM